MDHSIRVWSLDPKYSKFPCALICAGEGHKEGVLTAAFHSNGRYLLSGGLDCAVCLWTLPSLPNSNPNTDQTTVLHYPHFSTHAVHSNFVDCVAFHHDLIISRSAEEHKIVLWMITNFSSSRPSPSQTAAPATNVFRETRSAFSQDDEPGYQRLLQFDTPDSGPFYMRFGLLRQPDLHPILAFGNCVSKVFLWDLYRLEEGHGAISESIRMPGPARGRKKHGSHTGSGSTPAYSSSNRETSIGGSSVNSASFTTNSGADLPSTSATSVTTTSLGALSLGNNPSPRVDRRKYQISDPWKELKAHAITTVPKVSFCARKAAWSVGGEWLVVVGDWGMVAIFERW